MILEGPERIHVNPFTKSIPRPMGRMLTDGALVNYGHGFSASTSMYHSREATNFALLWRLRTTLDTAQPTHFLAIKIVITDIKGMQYLR